MEVAITTIATASSEEWTASFQWISTCRDVLRRRKRFCMGSSNCKARSGGPRLQGCGIADKGRTCEDTMCFVYGLQQLVSCLPMRPYFHYAIKPLTHKFHNRIEPIAACSLVSRHSFRIQGQKGQSCCSDRTRNSVMAALAPVAPRQTRWYQILACRPSPNEYLSV